MTDITTKEIFSTIGSRVTSDQNSLVTSQHQKKDWEKIFIESEIAQDKQQNQDDQTKDGIYQDANSDNTHSRSAAPEILQDDTQIIPIDHMTTDITDGVARSGFVANFGVANVSDVNLMTVKSDAVTANNEIRVAIPMSNQDLQLKAQNTLKSGANQVYSSNLFAQNTKVGKVGLHVYQTEFGEMKIWMRDNSVSKHHGLQILRELKGIFSKIGVSLASFALNGEMLYSDNQETDSLSQGEVTI